MKVLKLAHITGGETSCTYDATECPALHEEINEMQYCEVGEEWKITVGEMDKQDFDELPEFTGW